MLKHRRIAKFTATAGAVLLAFAAFASLALAAAEQTRENYVAEVEPICKTNTKTDERLLGSVRKEVKQGKLKLAARQVARAAAAGRQAVKQIEAVPRPAADQQTLTKWLGYLGKEQQLLGEAGKALKAGKKARATALEVKLNHNGTLANNTVLGFEFHYCLIKSNEFG